MFFCFEPWSTLFLILCDFPAMAHNQKITNILEKKMKIKINKYFSLMLGY